MQNKANEQAMHWLYSMSNAGGFDAINAGNAIALINEQNRRLKALGAAFSSVRTQRDRAWEALEEARKGLETKTTETSNSNFYLYYCPRCRHLVETEEMTLGKHKLRICLECGEEV